MGIMVMMLMIRLMVAVILVNDGDLWLAQVAATALVHFKGNVL